uniref:Uncharacterized protein n=1 Tax=Quercus lobata TaxID=97700 RepID=A0A7N2QZK2_QUELO
MESQSMELKLMSCKDVRGFNFFHLSHLSAMIPTKNWGPISKRELPLSEKAMGILNGTTRCALICTRFRSRIVIMCLFILICATKVSCSETRTSVNYQVRSYEGKPNGVLSFSYKVNGKGKNNGTSCGSNITGFPIIHDHQQQYSHENEIHYPTLEKVHYPSLELLNNSEEPLFGPQEVHSYAPQAYHPPPDAYYAPPPPPLPPPPPMLHGPPFYPDPYKFGGGHGYCGPHASFWNGRLWFWVQINKVAYQSSLRPCKNGSFVH